VAADAGDATVRMETAMASAVPTRARLLRMFMVSSLGE
jgi:hypothetical protein